MEILTLLSQEIQILLTPLIATLQLSSAVLKVQIRKIEHTLTLHKVFMAKLLLNTYWNILCCTKLNGVHCMEDELSKHLLCKLE